MTFEHSPTAVRSALFLDFDNMYLRLEDEEPEAAEAFATDPLCWIRWLQTELPVHGMSSTEVARSILVKRCYLNPRPFGRFRAYFIKSGFETIDCPTLTAKGKTSADVHMVLDIMELLDHKVHYHEFIILSADADFTPVLLKLRRHDRRTTVVAAGQCSPAYKAAADYVVDKDAFLGQALVVSAVSPAAKEIPCPDNASVERVVATAEIGKDVAAIPPCAPSVAHAGRDPESMQIAEPMGSELSSFIQSFVSAASGPVQLGRLATVLREKYPVVNSDWLGCRSLKALLRRLDLGELQISGAGCGYVFDPDRHSNPAETSIIRRPVCLSPDCPELDEVAAKVHNVTETPWLASQHYERIYDLIASEINDNGYHLTSVSKAVRDACEQLEIPAARAHINFILRGIYFFGHRFGDAREEPRVLAEAMFGNTLTLCDNMQLQLTEKEVQLVRRWLMGRWEAEIRNDAELDSTPSGS